MDKNWLTKSSFLFDGIDMYTRTGIMLVREPEDVLLPRKRPRTVTNPNRDGVYDFGAEYYENRGLKLTCTTVKTKNRIDVREISYILRNKSEIRIWNEPEKYYIGQIYDETALNQIRNVSAEFVLVFDCEPFAYGPMRTKSFSGSMLNPAYAGTARTPTVITVTNTGTTEARQIQIIQNIQN